MRACGVNPADWKIREGELGGELDHAATLAAEGKLTLPIQQTFRREQFAEAERISQADHLSGKLVLLVG